MTGYNGKIVTLIGSTTYKPTFQKLCQELSLEGAIVLAPHIYSGCDKITLSDEKIQLLIKTGKRKIEMADEIIVINYDDYIGETTRDEIHFAMSLNKPIRFYHKTSHYNIDKDNYMIGSRSEVKYESV